MWTFNLNWFQDETSVSVISLSSSTGSCASGISGAFSTRSRFSFAYASIHAESRSTQSAIIFLTWAVGFDGIIRPIIHDDALGGFP